MRRRSERKKSSSPAPLPARRSRRSRKISENERIEDETPVEKVIEEPKAPPIIEEINEQRGERASSEEHQAASPVRKSRSTRTTPKKRNSASSQREKSGERKVETIPEEIENGSDATVVKAAASSNKNVDIDNKLSEVKSDKPEAELHKEIKTEGDTEKETAKEVINKAEVDTATTEVLAPPEVPEEDAKKSPKKSVDQHKGDDDDDDGGKEPQAKDSKAEAAERSVEEVKVASSLCFTASKDEEHLKTTSDVLDIQTEDMEDRNTERADQAEKTTALTECDSKPPPKTDVQKENHKKEPVEQTVNKEQTSISDKQDTVGQQRSVRKRKWLSKKGGERAPTVLAISTDSLKNIIADVVNPVPLSDVQLESSSEEEGLVTSDRETDERSMTPELRVTKDLDDGNGSDKEEEQQQQKQKPQQKLNHDKETPTVPATNKTAVETAASNAISVARSPSPARNRASHVLFITNLVRPFTVLQLKGLLARTGKIVDEDGFWIDRIKSKCYVAYATEDEAIETRHALHGVRWPVSNPKCLNVDFGSRTDMDRAIQTTKNEAPKYPQDNTRDNQNSGNTWSRLDASEKKPARPVREWDVGKKEPNERDKLSNERRRSSKERIDSRLRESDRGKAGDDAERSGQDRKRSRERERGARERERSEHRIHGRSRSGSPALKARKKENEPPIRLLDDLFRKTKGTPCIYWLPLTPEAIAEKEAFRQKRIEEHKLRIKEREERLKEREKDRERQRDNRRNRSNERRRTRSRERERRRY